MTNEPKWQEHQITTQVLGICPTTGEAFNKLWLEAKSHICLGMECNATLIPYIPQSRAKVLVEALKGIKNRCEEPIKIFKDRDLSTERIIVVAADIVRLVEEALQSWEGE